METLDLLMYAASMAVSVRRSSLLTAVRPGLKCVIAFQSVIGLSCCVFGLLCNTSVTALSSAAFEMT